MKHSTSAIYQMKREIQNYAKKISKRTDKDVQKFAADMIYGIIASERPILSQIADTLQEKHCIGLVGVC
jgi:hypothetical protein